MVVQSAEDLKAQGIDIATMLPGAETAISLICTRDRDRSGKRREYTGKASKDAIDYHIDSVCYDLTRNIESYGFRSLVTIVSSGSHYDPMGVASVNVQIAENLFKDADCEYYINTVYTRKKLPPRKLSLSFDRDRIPSEFNNTASLTGIIKEYAEQVGADLCGVTASGRISSIAAQLRPFFDGEKYFNAKDRSHPFKHFDPEVTEESRQVYTAEDNLPTAKSVIVIGLRYHKKVVELATKPPAEAVGPYAFQTYVTRWQGGLMASKIAGKLKHLGYQAVITPDLMGLGSAIASPRGFIEDAFCNRFAAVAAGLGTIAKSGRIVTPEFGTRQRFIAIVTDAELESDVLIDQASVLCETCGDLCVKACPTAAMSSELISFACEGVKFRFNVRDINRCDWSKRYAISGESGFKYLGSPLDEIPDGEITSETLAAALKKHDPIKKYRPVACEPCMIKCPYSS